MGLRVDREAALGWLGIEGYRPSGRVPPAVARPADDTDLDRQPASQIETAAGDGDDFTPAETPELVSQPGPAAGAEPNAVEAAAPEPIGDAPERGTSADRLAVTIDSPHRALAEAIARVAGIACETDDKGDCFQLDGERWELSTLAGDGEAKRRLWRALTARARRPRA